MSSSATGFGSWKKGGRVSDASAVTRNIRVVAQGQADATYASTQKKNPFRMSQAVLNTEAYGGQVLSLANTVNLDRYFVPRSFDAFINFSSLLQLNGQAYIDGNGIVVSPPYEGQAGNAFSTILIRPTDSFVVQATVVLTPTPYLLGSGFGIGFVSDPTWLGSSGNGVGLIDYTEGATPPPGLVIEFLTATAPAPGYVSLWTTAGSQVGSYVNIDSDLFTALTQSGTSFVVKVTYNHVLSAITVVLTQVDGNNYTQSFGPFDGINLNEVLGGSDTYIGVGGGTTDRVQVATLTGLTYTTFQA